MEPEKNISVEQDQPGTVTSRREKTPPHSAPQVLGPKFIPPKDKFFGLRVRVPRTKSDLAWDRRRVSYFSSRYGKSRVIRCLKKSGDSCRRSSMFIATVYYLLTEKGFIYDIAEELLQDLREFFLRPVQSRFRWESAWDALPICVQRSIRATSGFRYLPAASFIPLLLVWFGPTDLAKMGLLFIGVIFFLVSLILDSHRGCSNRIDRSLPHHGGQPQASCFGGDHACCLHLPSWIRCAI